MPDYKELPKRYQELKYFFYIILDYGDEDVAGTKGRIFDEISRIFMMICHVMRR